ncbi:MULTISPECIES: glycosyltransferase [Niastella]|uniref:Glycosyltransferase n=1 Tax=Niastella soli TaxID=2821487 RepID=A0ABS3Z391_9BACT|nr:glycosyltransferase [Niastella soli]
MINLNFITWSLFNHDVNQGKGAAIHTGIAQATGEYLLVQDADLNDPDGYNTLEIRCAWPGRCGIRLTIYG